MNFPKLIHSLDRFGRILPAIVADVDDADARWKPANGAWSILEIVCHLADEESDDFRLRVQLGLDDPTIPWPAIDPEGSAVTRKYNEQNLDETVARFIQERTVSVEWLKTVDTPNWKNTYVHPQLGDTIVGEVMTSWAAHDHLHLRQITKRLFEMNVRDGAPYKTDYAGEWKA